MTINEIVIPSMTSETKTEDESLAAGARRRYLGIILAPLKEAELADPWDEPHTVQEAELTVGYNVFDNVADTFEQIAKADIVVAYCGDKQYYLKNRYPDPPTVRLLPRKPDIVRGFYRDFKTGKAYWQEIKLRYRS